MKPTLVRLCTVAALAAVVPAQGPPPTPAQRRPPAATPADGIPECKEMKTTASGLQYGVLRAGGKDPSPTAADIVEVHYTGWLTNGRKFESSRDHGQPARYQLSSMIKGWIEGLQLMTPGARYKFVVPPALGFGEQGQGEVPPNSTLVFDVELLKVQRMPVYHPASADRQKATASGLKYEYLKNGTGAKVGDQDAVSFRYAIFAVGGQLLQYSEGHDNDRIAGPCAALPYPFLKEIAALARVGDVFRVEVPANLTKGRGNVQDTVWELELAGAHRVPSFRPLDPKQTVTTQSGLQYEVIAAGTGKSPKATDTVEVNYAGWLTNGTMFDSSPASGEPAVFPLKRMMLGWVEGLQLMREGGSFLLSVPPELAYGSKGKDQVPPNSTLVFLVELVAVK
jgi:FKBP-type peptidyl-prolyl cis-trans isomerase